MNSYSRASRQWGHKTEKKQPSYPTSLYYCGLITNVLKILNVGISEKTDQRRLKLRKSVAKYQELNLELSYL